MAELVYKILLSQLRFDNCVRNSFLEPPIDVLTLGVLGIVVALVE